MERIEEGMKSGRFDPIEATQNELDEGVLREGKHRLIIAKRLGLKEVPIKNYSSFILLHENKGRRIEEGRFDTEHEARQARRNKPESIRKHMTITKT